MNIFNKISKSMNRNRGSMLDFMNTVKKTGNSLNHPTRFSNIAKQPVLNTTPFNHVAVQGRNQIVNRARRGTDLLGNRLNIANNVSEMTSQTLRTRNGINVSAKGFANYFGKSGMYLGGATGYMAGAYGSDNPSFGRTALYTMGGALLGRHAGRSMATTKLQSMLPSANRMKHIKAQHGELTRKLVGIR